MPQDYPECGVHAGGCGAASEVRVFAVTYHLTLGWSACGQHVIGDKSRLLTGIRLVLISRYLDLALFRCGMIVTHCIHTGHI